MIERTEHLSSSSRVLAVYPGTPCVVVTDAQPDRVTYFDAA